MQIQSYLDKAFGNDSLNVFLAVGAFLAAKAFLPNWLPPIVWVAIIAIATGMILGRDTNSSWAVGVYVFIVGCLAGIPQWSVELIYTALTMIVIIFILRGMEMKQQLSAIVLAIALGFGTATISSYMIAKVKPEQLINGSRSTQLGVGPVIQPNQHNHQGDTQNLPWYLHGSRKKPHISEAFLL